MGMTERWCQAAGCIYSDAEGRNRVGVASGRPYAIAIVDAVNAIIDERNALAERLEKIEAAAKEALDLIDVACGCIDTSGADALRAALNP